MKKHLVFPAVFLLAVSAIFLASINADKAKATSNEPPLEYILYTYEIKGEEFAALKQRYWSLDEAAREELSWEIGRLLGYSDNVIRGKLYNNGSRGSDFDSMMRTGAAITVTKRYLVSDGHGNVENVTEEEAYRIAAEINTAREAEFQALIVNLIGK